MPLKGQIEGETQEERMPSFIGNVINLATTVLGSIKKDVLKDLFLPIWFHWSMISSFDKHVD
jgi:hypothetical protein